MKILNFILISSIVLLSLIVNSCEQGYQYSYNLFNNTDSIIYVNFKTRVLRYNYCGRRRMKQKKYLKPTMVLRVPGGLLRGM